MKRLWSIAAALLILALCGSAQSQIVMLSPTPIQHFVDNNGVTLAGGKLFTYAAGTTTKLATYTDSTGATANTNPIILNARGEPQNSSGASVGIWLTTGASYKFVLAPATDSDPPSNPIWTVDNMLGNSAPTSNPVMLYVTQRTSGMPTGVSPGDDTGNLCTSAKTPCLTLAHAELMAASLNSNGGQIQINTPYDLPGTIWNEDIVFNGRPIEGTNTNAVPSFLPNVRPAPEYMFDGNGATDTTVAGSGDFCFTVAASYYAPVGVENATFTGDKTSCQSTFFDQIDGIIDIYGGVVLGPSSVEMLHSENASGGIQIWQPLTVNCTACGDQFEAVSDLGQVLQSNGVITFKGNETYKAAFLLARDGGVLQTNISPPFALAAGASITTRFPLEVYDAGILELANGPQTDLLPIFPATWSDGIVFNGGRVRGDACLGGSAGCHDTTPPTNGGSGATYTMSEQATPYGGSVDISAGTGASTGGSIFIGTPYSTDDGAYFNNCIAQTIYPYNWQEGATAYAAGDVSGTGSLIIVWFNNGVPLTAGGAYPLRWVCNN